MIDVRKNAVGFDLAPRDRERHAACDAAFTPPALQS